MCFPIRVFKLIRCQIAEGAMSPFEIIESFNILKKRKTQLLHCIICPSIGFFLFQVFEEAFADCIVERISLFWERSDDTEITPTSAGFDISNVTDPDKIGRIPVGDDLCSHRFHRDGSAGTVSQWTSSEG